MRYPEFLKKEDTIGFVSPSFGCVDEPYRSAFLNALKNFINLGYKTDVGENSSKSDGIGISSTPENCGKELMDYYLNDNVNALISCGGGELMCEVLDYVDFELLSRSRPKWYMGFSDNTNMTFLSAVLMDTAAIYGPCAGAFGMEPWHKSIYDALNVLTGENLTVSGYDLWEKNSVKDVENPLAPYNVTEKEEIKRFPDKDMVFSGRLLGGCLDCMTNLAGTKYDKVKEFADKYKDDGIIWVIEACDLNVMSIRRAMWELDHCGWFKYTKGFLFGRPVCIGQEMMGLNHLEAALGIIRKYNVPVIMDLDIGHMSPMMPLIIGSYGTVETHGDKIEIKMELKK